MARGCAKLRSAAVRGGSILMFAWAGHALAQTDFPNRPVRLINPFAPGGSVDLVSRSVAQGLTEIWRQQVIVDNRPGAGTTIGTEIVTRAEPNGYTMLLNSSAIAIMPTIYPKLRFDTMSDLAPVVQTSSAYSVLAVHPAFPPKTVKELIALAKAQPGRIPAASSGVGSTNHLILEMFKTQAKVDLLHVPYKGGGPAVADLMSGQVKIFFNAASTILPLMKLGRVRGLAVTTAQRADDAPELPTVAEAGVAGFEATTWMGIYGPRELPASLARRWNEAVNQYLKSPRAQKHLRSNYQTPVGGNVASFVDFHQRETARWREVILGAGIKTR